MRGVVKIKLCRPLDPIEFQKRFCNDFAPNFDACSAPFASKRRLQTGLEPVPELQAVLFGSTWDARDSGQKNYQFRRPHLEPPWTPQGVNLTPKRRPNELQTCSRPALRAPLNIAWSPISKIRPFLINFGYMWE